MRPRIHQKEATYVLKCLTEHSEKLQVEKQKLLDLMIEVIELKQLSLFDPYGAMQRGYNEKRILLDSTKFRVADLSKELELDQRLIAKYKAISENQPHDGRYKHLANIEPFLFNC